MTRRNFVSTAAALAPFAVSASGAERTKFDGTPPRSAMGIATTSYMTYGHPRDTYQFLEHCNSLGAGGIQSALTSTDAAYIKKLRSRAEQLGMFIETMAPMPKSSDMGPFERALAASKEVGAVAVRVGSSGGRRYEKWNSLADWQAFVKETHAAIARMAPLADKAGIPVGIENHKDFTIDEALALMKKFSTEHFGVLLDFGNNISLLDAPMSVLELAPYAKLTHVKDMAMESYPDGFLLSEVVLGEGILDLKKIVAAVREKQPKTRFTLEMITRDPLEVPCLTDHYWITFPERSGLFLARTLKTVQRTSARLQDLPRFRGLPKNSQLAVEDENVQSSLYYARQQLGL